MPSIHICREVRGQLASIGSLCVRVQVLGNQTLIFRLGGRFFLLLSHLTAPQLSADLERAPVV